MGRVITIFLILFLTFGGSLIGGPLAVILEVEKFGAKSNDGILDTEAINKAIDSCSTLEGRGTVVFTSGTYLSGSIHLKSNVTLLIGKEAKIQAAPKGTNSFDLPELNKWSKYQDFVHSHFHNALIWGEDINSVTIKGEGTISGAGSLYRNSNTGDADKAISLKSCKRIDIQDITINEGGDLSILVTGGDGLHINNVKIKTHGDGIDLVGTSNTEIKNCYIETVHKEGMLLGGGDALSLASDYSLGEGLTSKNIDIIGCVISAGGNALQIGPESVGYFRNIKIANITIKNADDTGISFTSNDGATIDGVLVENVTMENVAVPFFIKLSERKGGTPETSALPGKIKNIRINNVVVKDVYGYKKGRNFTSTIMGKPQQLLENIVLENIRMTYKGGSLSYLGLTSDPAGIELPAINDYRAEKYGLRPSYGLYCRYIKGLKMRNVLVDFEKEDPRPAVILRDIEGAAVDHLYAERTHIRDYDIILDNVSNFSMSGSLGVVQIEKKDFTPLTNFNVDAGINPTGQEVAKKLGITNVPVLLSELPGAVIEKIKKELSIPSNLLNARVSEIKKDKGSVYSLEAEDASGERYKLSIKGNGVLLSKKKI
jgi:hypothetical protein